MSDTIQVFVSGARGASGLGSTPVSTLGGALVAEQTALGMLNLIGGAAVDLSNVNFASLSQPALVAMATAIGSNPTAAAALVAALATSGALVGFSGVERG